MLSSFQFLTVKQLESNIEALLKKTIDKYGDRDNIPEDRRKQFNGLQLLISQLRLMDLSEETKAKIMTGALIHIKDEIASTCKKNAAWWFEPYIHRPERYFYKPENSIVYSNIDQAIGITDTNVLDEKGQNIINEAFRPYLQRIKLHDDIKTTKNLVLKHPTEKKPLTLDEEIKTFDMKSLKPVVSNEINKKMPIKVFQKPEAYMNGEGLTKYKYYKLAKVKHKITLAKDKMSKERFDEINQMKETIKSEITKIVSEVFSKKKITLDFFSKDKEKNREKFPKEKISKITESMNRSIDNIFSEEIFSDSLSDGVQEKMVDQMIDRLFLELSPEIKKFDPIKLKHVETRVKSITPFLEELRIEGLENTNKLTPLRERLQLKRAPA